MNWPSGKWIGVVTCVATFAGCAGSSEGEGSPSPDDRSALVKTEGELDRVYTLDHFVTVGPRRRVHAVEKFTLRSWLRPERRVVLLLPGTIVKSNFYDIDVDGYRFQSDLAKAGFFTFAIDSEGSGESSYPDDGHSVTHSFLVDEGRMVLNAIRVLRGVPRVDVLGEANGGAVAAELCADPAARTCVMSSMIYRTGTPFFTSVYFDPAFIAMIDNQPKGYMNVTEAMYFNIAPRSPEPVAAEIFAKQPGTYAVDPMLAHTHGLPWFDPTHARAPGLIIQGTVDDIATQSDAEDLQASYGSIGHGRAELVRIAGANHTPRIEKAPFNTEYQTAVLSFLNAH
ncbi:alpha/beta hydrolase [Pendulispora brunnea]|uniref:Alpha/beta hydrolase n=1 Tax=Pendulispora brunnea TaxID=2905690 RepID=A0ABZ2JUS2_9BACT